MMRNLFFLILNFSFFIFYSNCFAQQDTILVDESHNVKPKYYVIGMSKDTTFCYELTQTPFGNFKCKCGDGKKKSFDDKQVYSYKIREHVGGEYSSKWGVRTYYNMSVSAEKDSKKKFMSLVFGNNGIDLFMLVPRESSGPYGTSTGSSRYYLFDKGTFIDELTEENEKRYLPQLFKGCDKAMLRVAESIDFITKLDEATRSYRENCQ